MPKDTGGRSLPGTARIGTTLGSFLNQYFTGVPFCSFDRATLRVYPGLITARSRVYFILQQELPIGIFDSGVGGLTVYRALHEALPDERFVYLGDTARVPYGTKSLATVERYAVENARFLAAHGIKLLIVACNTASALALPALRQAVQMEVVGVIGPGARAAAAASKSGRIGVIATEATVSSHAYAQSLATVAPHAQVTEKACPLFVSLAEEGWAETDVARQVALEYLREVTAQDIDTLVLGCTHYPILRQVIQETVGASVRLIAM